MAQWQHCVTLGEVLWCWVVHCVVVGRCLSFGRPWHDLLWILLHSDRQVFVDQASCHTPPYLLVITSLAPLVLKSGVLIIQLHTPSAIFRTFAPYVILKFVCASTSQLCANRHMITGIKLLLFVPFSSSYPFVHYVWFSYQDWHPFVRGCTHQWCGKCYLSLSPHLPFWKHL